jgi:DNA repair protein RecO (recombination protein O)
MHLSTDAIVLHAFNYSETSRIFRLATRDAGVQSVIAKGARRPRSRYGSALDLFAQGTAQLYLKEGRDLQTLGGFEVTRARAAIGAELGRFASASAVAELVLRFGTMNEAHAALFDALAESLDAVAAADAAHASEAGLAGAWRLVAQLGFAPSVDACGVCHTPIVSDRDLPFSHAAGGVLCESCAHRYPGGRSVPVAARACIATWSAAGRVDALGQRETRAHQRLLREFLQHHLSDGRSLRAFDAWERGEWAGGGSTGGSR